MTHFIQKYCVDAFDFDPFPKFYVSICIRCGLNGLETPIYVKEIYFWTPIKLRLNSVDANKMLGFWISKK